MSAIEPPPQRDESEHADAKSADISQKETTPDPSIDNDAESSGRSRQPSLSKIIHTNSSRRLSGRAPNRSCPSLRSESSLSNIPSESTVEANTDKETNSKRRTRHHAHHNERADRIIARITDWLHNEKARQKARKSARHARLKHAAEAVHILHVHSDHDGSESGSQQRMRSNSDQSETHIALEELERILGVATNLDTDAEPMTSDERNHTRFRRRRSHRKGSKQLLRRGSAAPSSETEHPDNELLVPSAEVVLESPKTLSSEGGPSASQISLSSSNKRAAKEKSQWRQFKKEIVTLTHTLKIPGWRRVSIQQSEDIDVERLNSALSNAVYIVSPPKELASALQGGQERRSSSARESAPPKLLLRIYGSQAELLVDRESELSILRRLARKKIGPRLLGTFTNGRFEQFFYAETLTAHDVRVPETSKQIAKRMRELHDGIELLKGEREGGPHVWTRWDKSLQRAEEVATWLDEQVLLYRKHPTMGRNPEWKTRGFVCGTEWSFFRRTVDRYRQWLFEQYGGPVAIQKHLIFAHNDTQYGNLLRLQPSGTSPLLLPANEHKRLIVIDFEYASANLPGFEFADHFTEWCYDYHSPSNSHALTEKNYPTPDEQHRFLKAYIQHQPPLYPSSSSTYTTDPPAASSPPTSRPRGPSGSISSFILDSRSPPPAGAGAGAGTQAEEYQDQERQRVEALEAEIQRLRHETRLWRIACSAQWAAWGLVQAKVPGMNAALEAARQGRGDATTAGSSGDGTAIVAEDNANSDPDNEDGEEEEEEEHFDNLWYARDRVLLFWGDILQLGLVAREELPADLLAEVKMIEY